MTGVWLRGGRPGSGWQEYGRKTRAEMIHILRERALRQRDAAQNILDAADDQFVVTTYLGPIAMRDAVEVVDP